MDDQIKYRRSQTLENSDNIEYSVKINDQYSNTSRKKVGSILLRKKSDQNQDEQNIYLKQVGKIKRASHSTNRTYTQPTNMDQQTEGQYRNKLIKMRSDIKKISQGDFPTKLNPRAIHHRTKSYQQQRQELQKQLRNVLSKKNKLQELQKKKTNLRAKLIQLQFKLSEIKDIREINSISVKLKSTDRQNQILQKKPQTNTTKKLKKLKLKPLPLSLRKPADLKIKLNTELQPQDSGLIQEEDAKDYYYQAQLHHKCLNCKHFALKVDDVALSNQRIDQIIQTIKQSPSK